MKSVFTLVVAACAVLAFSTSGHAAPVNTSSEGQKIADSEMRSYPPYPPPYNSSYYAWGRAQNGWGYCYQWASTGQVLNSGQPVSDYNCESVSPSFYNWGRAQNGWGYCYHYTPQGYVMNQGQPVNNYSCEAHSPSYYRWGQGANGYTYCYQYGGGYVLNSGQPVSNYYCQY